MIPELGYEHPRDCRYQVRKPVLILTITPRVGSTQLASIIRKAIGTGVDWDEFLNSRTCMQANCEGKSIGSLDEYFAYIEESADDVVLLKTGWMDFAPWVELVDALMPSRYFVYLDRLDLGAQAFSLAKAMLTNEWHSLSQEAQASHRYESSVIRLKDSEPAFPELPKITSSSPSSAVSTEISKQSVNAALETIQRAKVHWAKYFTMCNINPLQLHYELLCENWTYALELISRHCPFVEWHEQFENISGDFVKHRSAADERSLHRLREVNGLQWCFKRDWLTDKVS